MWTHDHLAIDLPTGFVLDELITSWVAPAPDAELSDPRLAILDQARTGRDTADIAVRPNLVRRRHRTGDASLGDLATDLVAKALHNLGTDLREIESEVLVFDDGKEGLLTHFQFPARKFQLHQLHAFRLDQDADGQVLTQLTLTLDANQTHDLDDAKKLLQQSAA